MSSDDDIRAHIAERLSPLTEAIALMHGDVDAITARVDALVTERDALRAEVAQLRAERDHT